MKNKITKFSLFRDWLQDTLLYSSNRADVAASNIRTLEDYLAKNIKHIPVSQEYTKGNPAINKAMPIRGLYDYLDKLNRINNRGPKERLAIQAKIIADVKSAIVSILEFTQKIGKKEKANEKNKEDGKQKVSIEVLNNLSNCRTTFAVYVKFLEAMYRLESMDEIVAIYFSKAGKRIELTPKKYPVGVEYFKKGIVRALRHVGVFLTDTDSQMITMTLDTLTKLLDEYAKQYKQDHDPNDLGLFRGLSLVTSIGADSKSSTSTNFKIQSWEDVFLKRAKIKVNGEVVNLGDNDNVLFCPGEQPALIIYNNDGIRGVEVPLRCSLNSHEQVLRIRPSRIPSIHQEDVVLSELCNLCHHILDDMCECIPFADNKSEACKFIKQINANFNKLQSAYELKQAELDECSGKKCSRYNLSDLRCGIDSLLNGMDPQYLINYYRMACEILQEYGSHYEIELVAE